MVDERLSMSIAPLYTTPVALDIRLGWIIYAAWIMPALIVAARKTQVILFQPLGAAPTVVLETFLCASWLVLATLPVFRGLLIDIGRLLLAKLRFVLLFLITCVVLILASSSSLDSLWGAGASMVCLTAAAAYAAFQSDRKRFFFTLALLSFNGLLLIALDIFVGAYVLPMRSHNNVFIEHDPILGWKLRRGISIARRNSLYISKETINDMGFRTRPLPVVKSPGVKRIVFLGDSHTESYTVNDEEMYPVLIEKALSEIRPVEALSLGVGGFSTDQELLAYLHYGRIYQPDLVVLQYCSNDVLFNVLDRYWRGKKPRFQRYGDFLLLSGVPVPNLRDTGIFGSTLLQRSSLILLLEATLRQLAIKRSVEQEADAEEAWRVTTLLIRDLDRVVRSDGARLVVFQADRNPEGEARLRAILEGLSIPYLETAHAYSDAFDSYWVDGHWNQKGHHAIAAVLSLALRPYLQKSECPSSC